MGAVPAPVTSRPGGSHPKGKETSARLVTPLPERVPFAEGATLVRVQS
jgi:hypothetical protein